MNYIAENIDLISEKLHKTDAYWFFKGRMNGYKNYLTYDYFADIESLEHSFNFFLQKLAFNDTKYLVDNDTVEEKGNNDKTKEFERLGILKTFEDLMRSKKWRCKPFLIDLTVIKRSKRTADIYSFVNSFMRLCCQYRCPCILIAKEIVEEIDSKNLSFLARYRLLRVRTLIPSVRQPICKVLDPDQPGLFKRLALVDSLRKNNIQTEVLVYPLIPMLNDKELYDISKLAFARGCSLFTIKEIRKKEFFKNLNTRYKSLFTYSDLRDCKFIMEQFAWGQKKGKKTTLSEEAEEKLSQYQSQYDSMLQKIRTEFFPKRKGKKLNLSANSKFKTEQLNLF